MSMVANDATEELNDNIDDDAWLDDDEHDDDDDNDFIDDDVVDGKITVGCSSNFKCCSREMRSGCDNDCMRMVLVSTALFAGSHSSDMLKEIGDN